MTVEVPAAFYRNNFVSHVRGAMIFYLMLNLSYLKDASQKLLKKLANFAIHSFHMRCSRGKRVGAAGQT